MLEVRVTGHRADHEAPILAFDVAERIDPVDVDQARRPRKPEVHERHQALTAREHLAVVAMASQQIERLLLGLRVVVLEPCRLHARASSTTRCGLRGRRVTSTPSASETALAIAAPTAAVPPSPAPFTPRGLSGDGASSVMSTSRWGTSSDVGNR